MEEKDIIRMSRREWKRLGVIEEVIEKQMSQRKTTSILGLSKRQIRELNLPRFTGHQVKSYN